MDTPSIKLYSAGYSVHCKPFQSLSKSPPSLVLLRLQLKGTCKAVINGRPLDIEPGDLILSRPWESYQLFIDAKPGRESADYYLICEGEWINRWLKRCDCPGKASIELSDDILFLWRRLIDERRNLYEDNAELIDSLLRSLCLMLERAVRQRASDMSRSEMYLPYRIKRYIEQHATEPLALEDIARHHGVSVSTAAHLFKRTFSQSIIRYAVEVRLSIAAERIVHTDLPLEDISDACGFRSYPYFCRAFRSRYQLPPSQYRSRRRRSAAFNKGKMEGDA